MSVRQTKFYRDKRNGRWFGVCAGISDYTGIGIGWVRVAAILLTLAGGFPWTLIAYAITAWVVDDRPQELTYETPEERKFWQGVRTRPGNSVRDVRSSFRDIDRRLSDLEVHFTSPNRQLANEIDSLR